MMYEFIFLLPTEEEVKTIQETVTSLKGKITREDKWGKKTLAYPIKKNQYAYYFYYSLAMDQTKIQEFKKKLNFNDKLIRYLLLKVEN